MAARSASQPADAIDNTMDSVEERQGGRRMGSEEEEEETEEEDDVSEEDGNGNIEVDHNTRGRKTRDPAPIWKFGGLKMPDGSAKCTLCTYTLIPKTSNTSNLTSHVRIKHKDTEIGKKLEAAVKEKENRTKKKQEAAKKGKESGMLKFVNRQPFIGKDKKDELDKCLVKHFIMSNSPFYEADEWSFRNLMFKANPGYLVQSCSHGRYRV